VTRWGYYRHHPVLHRYSTWAPICRAPCGVAVDPSDIYQIRGLRVVASAPFMIPQGGAVSLAVDVGHQGPRAGGILLTTFGGIATTLGITFTAIGSGLEGSSNSGTVNTGSQFLRAGLSLLGIGGTMLISGIVVIVLSRTTVRTIDGYRLAATYKPSRLSLTSTGLRF
jgi:hypothetical protein